LEVLLLVLLSVVTSEAPQLVLQELVSEVMVLVLVFHLHLLDLGPLPDSLLALDSALVLAQLLAPDLVLILD